MKNIGNELARFLMGTSFLIKRVSEAFSLVMKTHNCLNLLFYTRNMCPHLVYVYSHAVYVLNWHTCPHLAYVSSPDVQILCW